MYICWTPSTRDKHEDEVYDFFSKVLVGVASGLLIEPGNDDAKIIMSGDFE